MLSRNRGSCSATVPPRGLRSAVPENRRHSAEDQYVVHPDILLFGALEEAHVITANMVDAVASELEQIGPAAAETPMPHPATNGSGVEELSRRVDLAGDHLQARQERIFRRLLDVLGGMPNACVTANGRWPTTFAMP